MSATWDYAQHSHLVAAHGGPVEFTAKVARAGFARGLSRGLAQGRVQGSAVGALVTAVVLGVGAWGVDRYKREQARLLAAEEAAKQALLSRLGDDVPKDD